MSKKLFTIGCYYKENLKEFFTIGNGFTKFGGYLRPPTIIDRYLNFYPIYHFSK